MQTLSRSLIRRYNGIRAGVVQWQYRSFPSFGRGFDSHRPLQILKHLRYIHIFPIFHNHHFSFRNCPECTLDERHWDFPSVFHGHSFAAVSHLLTKNRRI